MNWTKLFTMQKDLDAYIAANHDLADGKDLFQEKILALLVELGELANETRCFKFWSTKPRSAREPILEEYVDGIHFLLSLGLEKNYIFESKQFEKSTLTEVEQFHKVFETCLNFSSKPTQLNYGNVFRNYLQLGEILGFNETDIQTAYYEKNEVNYVRQNQGY